MESYIELQLDVQTILAAAQFGIGAKVAQQRLTQFTAGGTQYVVQDVQTGTVSLLPPAAESATVFYQGFTSHPDGSDIWADTIPSTAVRFNVGVTYHLTGGGSDAGLFNLVLGLRLDMSGGVSSFGPPVQLAQPQMILHSDGVTGPAGADPAIAAALQGLLSSAAPPVVTPVSVGSFAVTNTGAAVDSSGSRIALRLQVGWAAEDYTKGQWTLFYNGANVVNHLDVANQKNVSLFLTGDLIKGMVQQSIETALAQHTDTFTLQGGISSNWAPTPAGGAHVDTNFNGDANPPSPVPSIHVDVSVGTDISVASSPADTMQIHAHVDWSANLLQELVDVLVAGFAGALAGVELAGAFGGWVGWIGGMVAAIVAFDTYTPDLSAPSCSQSGNDINCTKTLQLPINPATGQPVVNFNTIAGAPDGMIIFVQLQVGGLKIQTVTLRTYLRSINFNFAHGLASLGTQTINAQYIGSA